MLNKDSIESAIILTKLLNKEGRCIDGIQDGTLVSMILKESEVNSINVDFDLSAIEDGNYNDLINQIYDAHLSKGSVEDEFNSDEVKEHIHDAWINNYSRDIARAIENNLELAKLIVIPQIQTLYESLIECHNQHLDLSKDSYFVLNDVIVPAFLTTECFKDLVKEHADHEAIEKKEIDHTLSLSADNASTIEQYLIAGGQKLSCVQDLNEISPQDKIMIVDRYLKGCNTESPTDDNLTLTDMLVLVSFFAGVVENPYFNSASSGTDNRDWADYHLHLLMNLLNQKTIQACEELRGGRLVSSTTYNINGLYPRPSVDGNLIEVNVYFQNFEKLPTTLSPDQVIGGLVVSGIPLSEVTMDYLTVERLREIERAWGVFLGNASSSNSGRNKAIFQKKATEIINNFMNTYRNSTSCDVGPIADTDIHSEEDIYEIAKTVVCDYIYHNTNMRELVNAIQEGLEGDESTDVISMNIASRLVTSFMLRQIYFRGI